MSPTKAGRAPVILLIGTVDTKSDEMAYLRESVESCGGSALIMDVGVLGKGGFTPDILNTDVAAAAGVTMQQVMATGDENTSMKLMATGASLIATQWYVEGRFDGLLALGGTMGTDLALDVANALPLGCPKVVLSTIAYSPLIPPDRIPPDLIMRLWAGGLYGLNRLCKAALGQAAGAVVGACLARAAEADPRPVIGMTSLGSSALSYMKKLKPALEARGYELAVFHTTGMGGRAFEDLARRGYFAAVMDFSLQELVNDLAGSCVSAGSERLLGAGRAGVPQIVAPGATDMVDFAAWTLCPEQFIGRSVHEHNRLIASVCIDPEMRRHVARAIADRLEQATGPTCLLLPTGGVEQWDRPGEPLHDPEGLKAFSDEMVHVISPDTVFQPVDAHINDEAFAQAALRVFDGWVAAGLVPPGVVDTSPHAPPLRGSLPPRGADPAWGGPAPDRCSRAPAKALVLDFGGVISRMLFETHHLSEQALGLKPGTLTWKGPFDPASDPLWQAMQADQLSERDYWMTRTREVGRLLGEDWDRMETFVQRARGADVAAVIRPEAVSLIQAAKAAGKKLAILSNELDLFYGADFRSRLPLLQLFDVTVDATYTGILKPDPRAYAAVTEALGLPAHECVFVDDQKRNADGGVKAGMQVVHFDVLRPAESFAQAQALLGI